MNKVKNGLFILFAVVVAVFWGYSYVMNEFPNDMHQEEVRAIVMNKEYIPSEIKLVGTFFSSTETEYNITFKYQDFQQTVNDSKLYDKYKKGDEVRCTLVTDYNKRGKIATKYFKIK